MFILLRIHGPDRLSRRLGKNWSDWGESFF
jgi:hypothetical protein